LTGFCNDAAQCPSLFATKGISLFPCKYTLFLLLPGHFFNIIHSFFGDFWIELSPWATLEPHPPSTLVSLDWSTPLLVMFSPHTSPFTLVFVNYFFLLCAGKSFKCEGQDQVSSLFEILLFTMSIVFFQRILFPHLLSCAFLPLRSKSPGFLHNFPHPPVNPEGSYWVTVSTSRVFFRPEKSSRISVKAVFRVFWFLPDSFHFMFFPPSPIWNSSFYIFPPRSLCVPCKKRAWGR